MNPYDLSQPRRRSKKRVHPKRCGPNVDLYSASSTVPKKRLTMREIIDNQTWMKARYQRRK